MSNETDHTRKKGFHETRVRISSQRVLRVLQEPELLHRNEKEKLLGWFTNDYVEQLCEEAQIPVEQELEHWNAYGVTECETAGEGGIYTALWNLSGAYRGWN